MEQPNQTNADDLASVIDGLFASTVTSFTTSTGVEVQFKRTGIVQLAQATEFFQAVINAADPKKLDQFIQLVAVEQQKLLSEGKTVNDINLNNESLLRKALDNQSLLLTVFSAVAEKIPAFVAIFSTITPEQFNELSLDEQLVCAAGVFAVNYGFFTQSLPPLIKSAIAGWQRKQSANQSKQKENSNKAAT